MGGVFKNDFSWSWSRRSTFETCLRKYYYQHYGFWGGWKTSADAETRELYIQKKLLTRAQWMGIVVHEAAEWTLKAVSRGGFPPPEDVVARFGTQARRQILDSQHSRYLQNPKRFPGFVEHYYRSEEADWTPNLEEIERQVRGLFTNPVFLRLTSVAPRILEVEELRQIRIDDVPVWVSLDALVQDGNGGFVIVDWKTGQNHTSEKVMGQLGIYGLYVLDAYVPETATPRPSIQAMYVNTRHSTYETVMIDQEAIDTAKRVVRDSAEKMRSFLRDIPENHANKADFPMLPEDSLRCQKCAYRRSCDRE